MQGAQVLKKSWRFFCTMSCTRWREPKTSARPAEDRPRCSMALLLKICTAHHVTAMVTTNHNTQTARLAKAWPGFSRTFSSNHQVLANGCCHESREAAHPHPSPACRAPKVGHNKRFN
jgi:hypothetical protein